MQIRPPRALILAAALAVPAASQEFPSSPVRFVVPLPAGGTLDIMRSSALRSRATAGSSGRSVLESSDVVTK